MEKDEKREPGIVGSGKYGQLGHERASKAAQLDGDVSSLNAHARALLS